MSTRKKKKSDFVNYDFGSTQIAIRESKNLARWNPKMSVATMEKARNVIFSEIMEQEYNKAVNHINTTFTSIENKFYYKSENYWGDTIPIRLARENNFE